MPLQDYPRAYLKRFDELCQRFPHTGVAGDDAHHNIGIKIIRGEKDLIIIEDLLGDKKAELSISTLPFLAPWPGRPRQARSSSSLISIPTIDLSAMSVLTC